MLRDTASTVASVAQEVGYQSEAAFARAFKRSTGRSPSLWRREAKG
ncbi:MAG: AraC family transcriptional regulator [Burkholderiales bacterium]